MRFCFYEKSCSICGKYNELQQAKILFAESLPGGPAARVYFTIAGKEVAKARLRRRQAAPFTARVNERRTRPGGIPNRRRTAAACGRTAAMPDGVVPRASARRFLTVVGD
jgi:hypothetical protein